MGELLKDKVIAVIGGGGLIGRAIMPELIKEGACVVTASRSAALSEEELHALPQDLQQKAVSRKVDVNDTQSVETLFEGVLESHGRLDAVVNLSFPRNENFGAVFEKVTYEDFTENVSLHLGGAFLVSQKAADILKSQGGGVLINTSSIYGLMPPRFELYKDTPMTKEVEYAVSKAAIIHLTRYLAKYMQGSGVRVNCISPGGVIDNQPAAFVERYNAQCNLKGMLDGHDIAGSIVYLCSDMAKHVTGQNIVVDDGFSL